MASSSLGAAPLAVRIQNPAYASTSNSNSNLNLTFNPVAFPLLRLERRQWRRHGALAPLVVAALEEAIGERQPVWVRLAAAASAAGVAVILSIGFALGDSVGFYSRYAREYKRRGMELFSEGDVSGALEWFDRALKTYPDELPYLWQRGICLYYVDRFEEGAAQFRANIQLRPDDTEELVWCFLCEAQVYGAEEVRKRMPPLGNDSRPFMNKVYELYKNGGDPQKMLSDLGVDDGQECFYLTLYAGLYYEALKDMEAAKATIVSACKNTYGSKANDYMAFVARNHCKVRNWVIE